MSPETALPKGGTRPFPASAQSWDLGQVGIYFCPGTRTGFPSLGCSLSALILQNISGSGLCAF